MRDRSVARVTPALFQRVYDLFDASVGRVDCGSKCAPLNGGEPVCCSTQHAVPVVHKAEWRFLRSRSRLWRKFEPYDAATREIVDTLTDTCAAIECKGARFCERDNRSVACRAFPFFPYLSRTGEFLGLAYYWDYEDRCWVISNLKIVTREFIEQFHAAFEEIFRADREEYETFLQQSAIMRRVFTRRRRPFPLICGDGKLMKVLPRGRGIVPARFDEFLPIGPYKSERAYRQAVAEAERAQARAETKRQRAANENRKGRG